MHIQTVTIPLPEGKKIFFASDFHLGSPSYEESREREKKIIAWIERHEAEMGYLFLLGDIFDYWFEYRHVVPKGFVRLLAKLAHLTEKGIPVHFFCGNHDTWIRTYFQQEIGMIVHRDNIKLQVGEARFFIGHGDGLGPDDRGYKLMKTIFNARTSRILYAALHPFWGSLLASGLSKRSRRSATMQKQELYQAREQNKNRNLLGFMQQEMQKEHIDFFIFAHRHWPLVARILPDTDVANRSGDPAYHLIENHTVFLKKGIAAHKRDTYYMNTGDWIRYFSYGWYDGSTLKLEGNHLRDIF